MESKNSKLIKIESRMVVARAGVWGNEEMLAKGQKLPAIRLIHSEALRYSVLTIINNNALYT